MIKEFFYNNDDFRFLKSYYELSDSAERYGVSRMEIKHSNFLSWALKPDNNGNLGDTSIRNLLKLIQSKSTNSDKFNKLDLNSAVLSDIDVKREFHNIDLFITLNIDGEGYAFIIENKVYAIIHDNQLRIYKDAIREDKEYCNYELVCAFLYTNYQDEKFINGQLEEVKEAGYTPFTYQDVYEQVLLPITEYSTDSTLIFIISEYIHCLANYTSDEGNGVMIITKQDKKCLKRLFESNKEFMARFINEIRISKESNECTDFYKSEENHALLLMCFNKYLKILLEDEPSNEMISKLKSILQNKKYIMNNKTYGSIGDLLVDMFKYLTEKRGYIYEKLKEVFNHMYQNPLIIPEEHQPVARYQYWFKKSLEIGDKKYYVLSAWSPKEYGDLKDKINALNIGITLE